MTFFSTETWQQRGPTERLIAPFDENRVVCGAYELSLGPDVYVTSTKPPTKRQLSHGQQLHIPPGQFALLITGEEVAIPGDGIGLISIKAGVKFRGLVNISGFHVDPGFSGQLKFSVFNTGSENIVLEVGEPTFLLWIAALDRVTADVYHGRRQNQHGLNSTDISAIQGEIASPGALKADFDRLSTQVRILTMIVVGLFLAVVEDVLLKVL